MKKRVSILILLDVLLQLLIQCVFKNISRGFNPYFTGCSTSTEISLQRVEDAYGFQSLFYWMFYFNSCLFTLLDFLEFCFNPYFTGCSTSTYSIIFTFFNNFLFQSLFYWMFYFNYLQTESKRKRSIVSILILLDVLLQRYKSLIYMGKLFCFNPYFTGCSTSTQSLGSTKSRVTGFNPYFTGCSTSTWRY